jgi:hypothetical protein
MSDAAPRFRHVALVSRDDMYVGMHHRLAGIDSAIDTDVESLWMMLNVKNGFDIPDQVKQPT